MNLHSLLASLEPSFNRIELVPLGPTEDPIGWEAEFIDSLGSSLGGAVHVQREMAIQIGFAEAIERILVKRIRKKGTNLFNEISHPTSCGFAIGLNYLRAKNRSFAEALERWAWSKWIDEGHRLDSHQSPSLSTLAQYFAGSFDKVDFFGREFGENRISIAIGYVGRGAFAGSRVHAVNEDGWTHALSESWRHYLIFKRIENREPSGTVEARLCYFGENGEEARKQIQHAKKVDWPEPKVLLSKQVPLEWPGLFLYRTLMNDYVSWHLGGSKRFVY